MYQMYQIYQIYGEHSLSIMPIMPYTVTAIFSQGTCPIPRDRAERADNGGVSIEPGPQLPQRPMGSSITNDS